MKEKVINYSGDLGSLSGICQGTKVVYNKNIIKVNKLKKGKDKIRSSYR